MEMNDFETGFLASSRQVAHLLFGWPGRAVSAVCFFVLILNNAPALRAGNHGARPCAHRHVALPAASYLIAHLLQRALGTAPAKSSNGVREVGAGNHGDCRDGTRRGRRRIRGPAKRQPTVGGFTAAGAQRVMSVVCLLGTRGRVPPLEVPLALEEVTKRPRRGDGRSGKQRARRPRRIERATAKPHARCHS